MIDALLRRESDDARDLLGLGEEALRGMREAVALQRHDALIALVSHRMVEGDREIALAEQRKERRARPHVREPLAVEAYVSAKVAGQIIADEQLDRARLCLGLEGDLPFLLLEQ